jgi:outer membrane biosynthesis protein TonB
MAGQLRHLNTRRLGLGAGLVLAVLAVHLWLADGLAQHAQSLSAVRDTMPRRVEVAYVREMAITAPPPVPAPRPAPAPVKRRTVPPKPVVQPASTPASEPPAEPPLAVATAPEPAPDPAPA